MMRAGLYVQCPSGLHESFGYGETVADAVQMLRDKGWSGFIGDLDPMHNACHLRGCS